MPSLCNRRLLVTRSPALLLIEAGTLSCLFACTAPNPDFLGDMDAAVVPDMVTSDRMASGGEAGDDGPSGGVGGGGAGGSGGSDEETGEDAHDGGASDKNDGPGKGDSGPITDVGSAMGLDAMPVDGNGSSSLCNATIVATGSNGLVDDFEDGDSRVLTNDSRSGIWWVAMNETTTVEGIANSGGAPVPVAGGNPGKALHVKGTESGTGTAAWGVEVSAGFVATGACYNASKYTGVKVSIKGVVGSHVFIELLTRPTKAANTGSWRKEVTLVAGWQDVMVNFASGFSPGWGNPPPLDITKIYGVDVSTVPVTTPYSFDLWIDNVGFY